MNFWFYSIWLELLADYSSKQTTHENMFKAKSGFLFSVNVGRHDQPLSQYIMQFFIVSLIIWPKRN